MGAKVTNESTIPKGIIDKSFNKRAIKVIQ